MSTAELRRQLIEKIQSTNDESMLRKLFRLLELNTEEEPVVLSAAQKDKIDSGLKDIEEGRYFSSDQADKEALEWLKK